MSAEEDKNGVISPGRDAMRFQRMTQQLYRAANELKHTNQFQAMILENMSEGVVVFNELDQLAAFNSVFCDLYGLQRTALRKGMSVAEFSRLFQDEDAFGTGRMSINAHLRSLETGEFTDMLQNGTAIEVRLSKRDAGGFIVTYSDVTSHLEVQSILREQRQTLRDQVTELTDLGRSLEEARNKAIKSDKEKSRFLAMLSHDIRTPMSAMISTLEVLSKPGQDVDADHLLEVALASSRQMLFLLADIIEVSRSEGWNFKLNYASTAIGKLIASTAEAWQPFANTKGLDLRFDVDRSLPAALRTDPKRLRQVIDNLLSNAVKFTEDGTVALSAKSISVHGRPMMRIDVSDTGRGISEDLQEILFSEFGRIVVEDRPKVEGTGLGLATCKRIVESMGGQMGVVSTAGHGSTFWLELPILIPTERDSAVVEEVPTKPLARPDGMKPRILLADDAPSNRIVMAALLEKLGCQITAVSDGEDVLHRLRTDTYDVVLLDNYMLSMGGAETAREIRASAGEISSLPLIAITGATEPHEHAELFEAGVNKVMVKPICERELRSALAEFIR